MQAEASRARTDGVTAIIPTRGRPDRVIEAVRSVLAQSYPAVECLVVVDGTDPETVAALTALGEPRLRIHPLADSLGGGGARNAGVRAATTEWVAFLDDDDLWLPHKVERQMSLARNLQGMEPIIACQILARSPQGDLVWPVRAPDAGETVGDYLLKRRSVFYGDATVQTGMLMARRELLLRVPFREDLRRFQETDWLIRAAADPAVQLHFVMEPLAVWHYGDSRQTITRREDWRSALEWLVGVRPLISPAAFTDFLLTNIAHQARAAGEWSAFIPLLRRGLGASRPSPRTLGLYLGMWLVPQPVRRRLRALVQGRRSRG